MKQMVALIAGVIFGVGLAISGMTNTEKVIGFLDIFGQWQADLMWVMIGALAVTITGYFLVLKRTSPLFDAQFFLPVNKNIDKNLISGATLFGLGWGLYGYCPGPAIAALAYLDSSTIVFVAAMIAGMALFKFTNQIIP